MRATVSEPRIPRIYPWGSVNDLLAIYSIYLGTRSLIENEQQSDAQLKILRQNDITAANDKQAAYILDDINVKFDEQNSMIRKIMDKLGIKDGD